MKTEARIELIKEKIVTDVFLKARGLGNEIPFWIFDYPPEDELFIRHSIRRIEDIMKAHSIAVVILDLYELCLEIIQSKISYEQVIEFETRKGSDELLNKLRIILKPDIIKRFIAERLHSSEPVEVVFLVGIGKVWPLIRSHSILNNLQPVLGNIPLVVFYPGNYNNSELSLFGRFKDANYYRAFRMIDSKET
ncbi:MAG: DUF1788 domain-containing protein [Methanospirillaceae archaeon]|nr:DUF1788 domain-containing protein [Methanospirillaceae archaeon]